MFAKTKLPGEIGEPGQQQGQVLEGSWEGPESLSFINLADT